MRKNKMILLLAVMALMLSSGTTKKGVWTLDKNHAKLGFTITHLMVSDVEGAFKSFDAKITAPADDFTDAVVEMTADASSIDTDNENRDNHLKGADFFDAEKYPKITFKSRTFKKVKDNTYKVSGDLTMHGVTKTVELDAVCRMGKNPQNQKDIAGFKITGVLNRKDFGISTTSPNAMLSDEVILTANAEFSQE
jgi:polyisoprenoid-binding protein YceI